MRIIDWVVDEAVGVGDGSSEGDSAESPSLSESSGSSGPSSGAAGEVPVWVDAGLTTDVDGAPLEWLERNLMSLEAHMSAATGEWLIWLGEFEVQQGYVGWGMKSTADWLDARCGMSPTAARERVRIARALRELPKLREEMVAGRVTYSKVRAIVRVASVETESMWIKLAADATASQLEQLCAGVLHPDDEDDPSEAAHRNRRMVVRNNGDATGTITTRLPIDRVAEVEARVEHGVRARIDRACSGSDQTRQDFIAEHGGLAALRADALLDLIDGRDQPGSKALVPAQVTAIIDTRPTADTGFDSTVDADADADADRSGSADCDADSDADRDADSFGAADSDRSGKSDSAESFSVQHSRPQYCGRAVTDSLATPASAGTRVRTGAGYAVRLNCSGPVAVGEAVMRRLLCDATIDSVCVTDEGTPDTSTADPKRPAKRSPSTAMRRSVLSRDGGCCQYPGCSNRVRLHVHHVHHWIDGGPTQPDNLITICSFHHGLLHDAGYQVVLSPANQSPLFTRPDGRPVTVPYTHSHTHQVYNSTDSRPIDTPTAEDIAADRAEAPGFNGIYDADQDFDMAWHQKRLRGVANTAAEQRHHRLRPTG